MSVTIPEPPVLELADPWATPAPARPRRQWAWAVLALVVGSSGVLGRLWQLGVNARRAAVVLVVAAVLWEVLLRLAGQRRAALVGLAAVAVAAELVSAPSGGRAPALLLLGSVTVADAALVDWRPTPRWPRREHQVAGLAVPLLVVAQVVWYRTGVVPLFVGLLALALLVVECYHRWPGAVRPVDRAASRAVVVLGDAVGAVAVLVVAVPVYLAGLVGRVLGLGPASSRTRRRPSAWQPATSAAAEDVAVPFSSPAPAVRRRRHLVAGATVVVVALVVVGVVRAARTPPPSPVPPPAPTVVAAPPTTAAPSPMDLLAAVPYSDRAAFDGDPWADGLQRDQSKVRLVAAPTVGWQNAPTTATRWVNVRDGHRRSVPARCAGCPRATVWLVGGSSVFGIGQRDQGTVAAALARRAAAQGVQLDVVNLGVPGWTAHQEAVDALARLRSTADRPAAVVVVDGFNDVTAATAREVLGRGDDPSPLVFEENDVARALSSKQLTPAQVDRVVARSVRSLRDEHALLAAGLQEAGVPLLRFFQPDAFASPRQLAAVRSLYEVLPGLVERQELGDALARTAALLSPGTTNLRDTYDPLDRTVMLDVVHTNETGASLVADAVYQRLGPELRARTGRP